MVLVGGPRWLSDPVGSHPRQYTRDPILLLVRPSLRLMGPIGYPGLSDTADQTPPDADTECAFHAGPKVHTQSLRLADRPYPSLAQRFDRILP